jgi:16S rRNA (cytosine1402-N4)-methyltransferase
MAQVVMNIQQTLHIPVLLQEVLHFLQPESGGLYIDGTLGGGGHTAALLERSAPNGKVLGIDTDLEALARVRERLPQEIQDGRLVLAHGNFADMARIAAETGFDKRGVQGVLLDLGFSSDQMDNSERGFSFSSDGPLDMRLDRSLPVSAADLLNTASEQELADIIWRYGEETRSRAIARRIVRERQEQPIQRTAQLAKIVASGVPYKPGSIHPATKTFQALRIAVNQELDRLTEVLPQMFDLLSSQGNATGNSEGVGRMAIIAFHSLEDRIVKEFMRHEATDCVCPPRFPVCICDHKARLRLLTPRPVVSGVHEIRQNPRARSAKLRVAERIVAS